MTQRSWIAIYAAFAILTLIFQTSVRSSQCTGFQECGPSYAKAVAWSAIWPASWVVYVAGLPAFNRWIA